MARERRVRRLDLPRDPRRVPRRPRVDSEAFGRVSESIARFFGTARYLAIQTVIVILWIAYNVVAYYYHQHSPHQVPAPFDKYPFILLNLVFSTQAAYAAPLILLAQNRQADRDRVALEDDRARGERNISDTEYLTREIASLRIALGDVVTRDYLRSELQRLGEELGLEPGRDLEPGRRSDAGEA